RLEQEGHVVSPMICARDGEWLPEFIEPFLAATRTPAERRGDLSAQVGANQVAARRLTELIEGEGVDRFQRLSAALLDYGERRMRAAWRRSRTATTGSRTSWSGGTSTCRS